MMKRRTFLTGAVSAAAAAPVAFPSPAIAEGKRILRLVTGWSRNKGGSGVATERIAKTLNEVGEGTLEVKLEWNDRFPKRLDAFDAVSKGDAEMYYAPETYWHKKSAGFNFFTSLPYGMTPLEQEAWLSFMGGQELWDEHSERFNIKPFAAGNTGCQMGGWYNKEINTLEDMQGLKIRIPGIAGDVLKRAGAEPVRLPRKKIIPALTSGKVDAAEWIGPWSDMDVGLHKAAKYYYYPGFHAPGNVWALGINLSVWRSMSKAQQEIIGIACASEHRHSLAEFASRNGTFLTTLIQEHGIELKQFPRDVLNELGRISGDVVAEAVKKDPLLKRIYKSFITSRYDLLRWAKYSDEAFMVARRAAFRFETPRPARTVRRVPTKKPDKQIIKSEFVPRI
ncbi:MAG: TRAP transporter substrate-binding protein [Methyloligellaceae bacterium]